MEKVHPKNRNRTPNKHLLFLQRSATIERRVASLRNCEVTSDISKISRLKSGFIKTAVFERKWRFFLTFSCLYSFAECLHIFLTTFPATDREKPPFGSTASEGRFAVFSQLCSVPEGRRSPPSSPGSARPASPRTRPPFSHRRSGSCASR